MTEEIQIDEKKEAAQKQLMYVSAMLEKYRIVKGNMVQDRSLQDSTAYLLDSFIADCETLMDMISEELGLINERSRVHH